MEFKLKLNINLEFPDENISLDVDSSKSEYFHSATTCDHEFEQFMKNELQHDTNSTYMKLFKKTGRLLKKNQVVALPGDQAQMLVAKMIFSRSNGKLRMIRKLRSIINTTFHSQFASKNMGHISNKRLFTINDKLKLKMENTYLLNIITDHFAFEL